MASNQLQFLPSRREDEKDTAHSSHIVRMSSSLVRRQGHDKPSSIGTGKRLSARSSSDKGHRSRQLRAQTDAAGPFVRCANDVSKARSNRAVSGNDFMDFRLSSELVDGAGESSRPEVIPAELRKLRFHGTATAPAHSSRAKHTASAVERTREVRHSSYCIPFHHSLSDAGEAARAATHRHS